MWKIFLVFFESTTDPNIFETKLSGYIANNFLTTIKLQLKYEQNSSSCPDEIVCKSSEQKRFL